MFEGMFASSTAVVQISFVNAILITWEPIKIWPFIEYYYIYSAKEKLSMVVGG